MVRNYKLRKRKLARKNRLRRKKGSKERTDDGGPHEHPHPAAPTARGRTRTASVKHSAWPMLHTAHGRARYHTISRLLRQPNVGSQRCTIGGRRSVGTNVWSFSIRCDQQVHASHRAQRCKRSSNSFGPVPLYALGEVSNACGAGQLVGTLELPGCRDKDHQAIAGAA
jgi:hypothetical protein